MKFTSIIFGVIAAVFAVIIFLLIWQGKFSSILPDFNFSLFDSLQNDSSDSDADVSQNGNQDFPEGQGGQEEDGSQPTAGYFGSYPETAIISGPAEGEFVKDEAAAVFKFIAIWDKDLRDVVFETKVTPIDGDWQTSNIQGRAFNLLPGENEYIFQVRAKTKDGVVDPSPSVRKFKALVSPYMGKVQIITASPGIFPDKIMKVVLRSNIDGVDITGWKIAGTKGSFVVSKAVLVYRPNSSNDLGDIILQKGDSVSVFGQNSPISSGFRLNICSGYLNATYNFSPQLSNNCPKIEPEELKNISLSCRDYILSLNSCEVPNPNKLNSFAGDSACRSFADSRLNYRGCFEAYSAHNNFLQDEWFIYSGTNFLDPDADELQLRDDKGLLIDYFNY